MSTNTRNLGSLCSNEEDRVEGNVELGRVKLHLVFGNLKLLLLKQLRVAVHLELLMGDIVKQVDEGQIQIAL